MGKKLSRKDQILLMFSHPMAKYTCQEITNEFIEKEKLTGSVARYLSGSITTILAKLVKDNVLEYCDFKTPRGGHYYQLYRG